MDPADRVPPTQLTVERRGYDGGVVTLAVAGDIDMMTGDRFVRALTEALDEPGVTRLLVDLAALRFIDSNGVTALLRAHRAARRREATFGVFNVSEPVRSILTMLGVHDLLTAADDVK
ncbi:STAS domain-containing protein [Actinoplanes sp. NPDC049316]|uniref:STAS domain-containing protein n=1 Tax=Actinoplanes sp. NPDC049316 TaxID=3154727 RepID=UPI00343ED381